MPAKLIRRVVVGATLLIPAFGFTVPTRTLTCPVRAIPVSQIRTRRPVQITPGLQVVEVTNSRALHSGMRVRIASGTTLGNTKFVEGRVGLVRTCVVSILVDSTLGVGVVVGGRFSIAGDRGETGPTRPGIPSVILTVQQVQ